MTLVKARRRGHEVEAEATVTVDVTEQVEDLADKRADEVAAEREEERQRLGRIANLDVDALIVGIQRLQRRSRSPGAGPILELVLEHIGSDVLTRECRRAVVGGGVREMPGAAT